MRLPRTIKCLTVAPPLAGDGRDLTSRLVKDLDQPRVFC